MEKQGIILNRMYDGKYLQGNLGHEVINLFTEDSGRHFIYLNSDGRLPLNQKKEVSYIYILLIKRHCYNRQIKKSAFAKQKVHNFKLKSAPFLYAFYDVSNAIKTPFKCSM